MPRVKLIYQGEDEWAPPTESWGKCKHPPEMLRFDPRYAVPIACYCRACGEANIHPFHGRTDQEIEAARAKGREMFEWLNPSLTASLQQADEDLAAGRTVPLSGLIEELEE